MRSGQKEKPAIDGEVDEGGIAGEGREERREKEKRGERCLPSRLEER
jgi:hypothetical protein